MSGCALPWRSQQFLRRCRRVCSTVIARLRCLVWGVSPGPGSSFLGPFRIRRCPGSTIDIGASFRAEGGRFDNPVGLNCPNLVQTLAQGAVLTIGDDVGISGAVISCTQRVEIGDRVLIGANARIFDSDFHPVHSPNRRYDREGVRRAPVIVGDDCWLGAGAILLPGTVLGDNVVVAAGAVVTGSFGSGLVIGGVPARVIREMQPDSP